MDLHHLRYFLTILREGSMNRAATVLNINQSSLSRSMKALEKSVGASLFERGSSGLTVTKIGEEFGKHAHVIIRESEKALDEVAAMRGGAGGRICIGMMSGLSSMLMATVSAAFMRSYKDCRLDIVTSTYTAQQISRHLHNADWDVAVHLVKPTPDFDDRFLGISVERLKTVDCRIYCSPKHPLAKKRIVTMDDLAGARWASTHLSGVEQLLRAAFSPFGARPRIQVRAESFDLLAMIVEQYELLCFLPDDLAAESVKAGRLVPLPQDALITQASIALLSLENTERTPALRHLMTILRQLCDGAHGGQ